MVVGQTTKGCDVAVIGGGPAGYYAAIRLAQLGKDVILIEERSSLGGVCLNEGCIPSKALIHAADLYYETLHGEKMGLMIDGARIDLGKLIGWKDSIVKKLTDGVRFLSSKNGAEVICGHATFASDKRVSVETDKGPVLIDFQHAVIATGTTPRQIHGLPFDGQRIISSTEALSPKKLPSRLVVIGGGYVGLELGSVYAKLGVDVTVVEFLDELLPSLDRDVVGVLQQGLKKLGIKVYLGYQAKSPKGSGEKFSLDIESRGGNNLTFETDQILVTTGRKPNTDGLGLEALGVKLDEQGFVQTDASMRTGAAHIFAIGDVAGGMQLAHKAYKEAKVAAEVISGHQREFDNLVIPAVMYTDPEIATVGLNESMAKEAGIDIVAKSFPFSASGRAMTLGDTAGFVKVVAQKDTQRVLGVTIVGKQAGELISEAALAIEMGAFVDDIAETIHPHPTMAESVGESFEALLGQAIHVLN